MVILVDRCTNVRKNNLILSEHCVGTSALFEWDYLRSILIKNDHRTVVLQTHFE